MIYKPSITAPRAHGGCRPGAGRPPSEAPRIRVTLFVEPDVARWIERTGKRAAADALRDAEIQSRIL